MYSTTLLLHSYLRWVVLALAVWAFARAVIGWQGRRPSTTTDENAGRLFTIALDVQLLLGLLLYLALSPLSRAGFADFGAAMRDSVLRFWAVEHLFGMIVAIALAHIGRARAARQLEPVKRHRTRAIFYGLSLLVMLLTIPWPGMPAGRPLLRW